MLLTSAYQRRHCFLVGFLALCSNLPASSFACPFCAQLGRSFSDSIAEADLVAFGELSNPRTNPEGGGVTQLNVMDVFKSPPPLAGQRTLMLDRSLPSAATRPARRLVFAHLIQGRLDPYRLMSADRPLLDYLHGVLAAQAKPSDQRLAYFFGFLGVDDSAMAEDAYKEFAKAPYRDVRQAAPLFDPSRSLSWLKDERLPGQRVGLLGLLVGLGRRPADAVELRTLLDLPSNRLAVGRDGLLAGLALIDPGQGCEAVLHDLNDPGRGFEIRYAAVQAMRFLVVEEVVPANRLFDHVKPAIADPQIGDLVIDELRKKAYWKHTALVLTGAEDARSPTPVRAAILRYALRCPDPAAQASLGRWRSLYPDLIKSAEQSLRFEDDRPRGWPPSALLRSTSLLRGVHVERPTNRRWPEDPLLRLLDP